MLGPLSRTKLAAFTLIALVAASCTSQEAAAPVTAPVPSIDTATDTTPGTTSTTEPPTDTTADTTPDTVADTTPDTEPAQPAPTTTPAPSGQPTSEVTLVFAGGAADGWFHMGQWTGTAWQAPIDPSTEDDGADDDAVTGDRTPLVTSGDAVIVHELDVAPAEGTVGGGAAASVCSDDRVGPTINPDPGAPDTPDFGYRSIAFPADWNTQPRPVALVDADIAEYVAAGRAALGGTDTSAGTVKQIVVSDLDGDGDTEALVAFGGPNYSTLLLIDTQTRTALTVARSTAEITVPTTAAAGDPEPDAVTGTFSRFRTMVVADANGDGIMEFVVHSWENGSATATLYDYDGSAATSVLTAAC